jgi:hypothetical protein
MSDGFTIGAAQQISTIFECPKCRETIDSTAEVCRFCGEKVDQETALKAAAILSKVNEACSDATYMRSTALAIPVFFVLRFVPFFSWLGAIGFIALNFAIPIWALRWWRRFAKLQSTDADFRKARTSVEVTAAVVVGMLVLFVIIPFLLGIVFAILRSAHAAR